MTKEELEKENTALKKDWEVMKSTVTDCIDLIEKSKVIINQLLEIIYTESRTDIYVNEISAAEEYLTKEMI